MEFIEYPKWKYHSEKPAVIVNDKGEEKELGDDWEDAPIELSVDEAGNVTQDAPKRGRKPKAE